jgi:hypothetical protein
MEKWDPIGVHAFAEEDEDPSSYWDEYDSYMPGILGQLEHGGDVDALAEYLARRRTTDMGLDARPDLDRQSAGHIVAWNPRAT